MTRSTERSALCYGKLPVAGDFVRGDGNDPSMAEFDAWIQSGMHAASQAHGDGWTATFEGAASARFLWDGGDRWLAGCLWPSRDSAGRRYPFVIAAPLEGVDSAQYARLPIAMEPFFRSADELWASGWQGLNAAECAQRVHDLRHHYDADQAGAAERLGESPAAHALSDFDGALNPAALLAEVIDVAGVTPPRYCLRWPLLEGPTGASFWLSALQLLGIQRPRLAMWSVGAAGGDRLRLAWGGPVARAFAGMLVADLSDEEAYDAGCREVQGSSRYDSVVRSGTMGEALAALGGAR